MNVHFLQSAVIDDMNNRKRKIGGKTPKRRVWEYKDYELYYPDGMMNLENILTAEFVTA